MAGLTLHAYAKINLGLEVIRRRDDGYHELVTVLQTVSLYDEIAVGAGEVLTLHCDRRWMAGQHNLMWKAADLLQKESGTQQGAVIDLTKTIPIYKCGFFRRKKKNDNEIFHKRMASKKKQRPRLDRRRPPKRKPCSRK